MLLGVSEPSSQVPVDPECQSHHGFDAMKGTNHSSRFMLRCVTVLEAACGWASHVSIYVAIEHMCMP